MADDDVILSGRGLAKSYGRGPARVDALAGVDLDVRRGEFLAVMGPSGCGKTTLLHVLGLITPADAGALTIDGQPVTHRDRQRHLLRRELFGFVFQRFNLLGVLNAADNVALTLRLRGVPTDGRVMGLLETLGVADIARRKPAQMSMGQQQRVAVARALAHEPQVILGDEPTGNLDSANATALLELLRQVNRDTGQTIVMITHSAEAAAMADRIVRMRDGHLFEPTC